MDVDKAVTPAGVHHAAPKPSALMVPPPRMSLGAQDCTRNELTPSVRTPPTLRTGPR